MNARRMGPTPAKKTPCVTIPLDHIYVSVMMDTKVTVRLAAHVSVLFQCIFPTFSK